MNMVSPLDIVVNMSGDSVIRPFVSIASITNIANIATSDNIANNVMSPSGDRGVKPVGNLTAEDPFLVQPDLPNWVTCLNLKPRI